MTKSSIEKMRVIDQTFYIGIEYHHAYTQTGPPKEQIKYSGRVTRDTQTIERGLLTLNAVRSNQIQFFY